jgi:hypothetical protein
MYARLAAAMLLGSSALTLAHAAEPQTDERAGAVHSAPAPAHSYAPAAASHGSSSSGPSSHGFWSSGYSPPSPTWSGSRPADLPAPYYAAPFGNGLPHAHEPPSVSEPSRVTAPRTSRCHPACRCHRRTPPGRLRPPRRAGLATTARRPHNRRRSADGRCSPITSRRPTCPSNFASGHRDRKWGRCARRVTAASVSHPDISSITATLQTGAPTGSPHTWRGSVTTTRHSWPGPDRCSCLTSILTCSTTRSGPVPMMTQPT